SPGSAAWLRRRWPSPRARICRQRCESHRVPWQSSLLSPGEEPLHADAEAECEEALLLGGLAAGDGARFLADRAAVAPVNRQPRAQIGQRVGVPAVAAVHLSKQ